MWSITSRWRRRADPDDRGAALSQLHRLRSAKRRDDAHDPNPNRDYSTPFDGGQYPGVGPGGPL